MNGVVPSVLLYALVHRLYIQTKLDISGVPGMHASIFRLAYRKPRLPTISTLEKTIASSVKAWEFFPRCWNLDMDKGVTNGPAFLFL